MSFRSGLILWASFGIGLCLLGWWSLQRLGFALPGIDDAYIFFVYARNFAEGHGFVYNVGGERVEGFSSMLWVLVLSGVWAIFGEFGWQLMAFCVGICSLCMVLGVTGFERMVQLNAPDRKSTGMELRAVGALWIGVWALGSPGFVIWSTTTLMENCLWELLWAGSVVWLLFLLQSKSLSLKVQFGYGFVLGGLLLCRPEAMYWVCLLLFGLGVGRWCCGASLSRVLREIVTIGGICGLLFGGLICFRLQYFGYPLPNTYYAKVSPDRIYNLLLGLKYLVRFGLWHWGVLFSCVAVLLGFISGIQSIWRRYRKGEPEEVGVVALGVVCGLLIGGLCVAPIVGGDHFSFYRIFQVFWIMLPVPMFLWLWKRYTQSRGVRRTAIVVIGVLMGLGCRESWFSITPQSRISSEFRIVERDFKVGEVLNHWFSESNAPSIGVLAAGGIAYKYQGVVLDLMGLNLVDMAHSPGDRKGKKNHAAFNKEVFWQIAPDIFLPNLVADVDEAIAQSKQNQTPKPVGWDPFRGLREDKRFIEEYTIGFLDKGDGTYLGGAFHREFLNQLEGFGFREYPVD